MQFVLLPKLHWLWYWHYIGWEHAWFSASKIMDLVASIRRSVLLSVCADNLTDAVDRLSISGSISLSVNALQTEGNYPLVQLPTGKYNLKMSKMFLQFIVHCTLNQIFCSTPPPQLRHISRPNDPRKIVYQSKFTGCNEENNLQNHPRIICWGHNSKSCN